MKHSCVTLLISIAVISLVTALFAIFHGQPQHDTGSTTSPSPKPDVFADDIQNEFFRKIYARDELKKIARDPDSVVVEYTTAAKPSTFKHVSGRVDGATGFIFDVGYRAKNGFGGYTRDVKTLVCDVNGHNVTFVDPFSLTSETSKKQKRGH